MCLLFADYIGKNCSPFKADQSEHGMQRLILYVFIIKCGIESAKSAKTLSQWKSVLSEMTKELDKWIRNRVREWAKNTF